jgi:hypothetical protein
LPRTISPRENKLFSHFRKIHTFVTLSAASTGVSPEFCVISRLFPLGLRILLRSLLILGDFMGYETRYSLSWKARGDEIKRPNCKHNPPEGAKFCPQCSAPVGIRGLTYLMAEEISKSAANEQNMGYAIKPTGDTLHSTS